MTTALAGMTAEELVGAAAGALDLAHGLGENVTVAGLSSTAVATAWLVGHREDLNAAVIIAPARPSRGFDDLGAPARERAPPGAEFFVWWDSKTKGNVPGPLQC